MTDIRLVADIGGTNARFAWNDGAAGVLRDAATVRCDDHPDLPGAVRAYLETHKVPRPRAACFAVAASVDGDRIALTNGPWRFSRRALGDALGLGTFRVINDFDAQARALAVLGEGDSVAIGTVRPRPGTRAILGPGTGLGVAAAVPANGGWRIVSGEGGHASFAPVSPLEHSVLEYLAARHGRVSNERLLSGSGLVEIHQALAAVESVAPDADSAAAITAAALSGASPACRRTVELFLDVLASVAGDVALYFGATGGVFVAGGIVPRILGLVNPGRFRRRFADKGRMGEYAARIATRVVTAPGAGLAGALQCLEESR